jgi:hypothetical protein
LSEQEREKVVRREGEEPDVEAHKVVRRDDAETPADEGERESGDDPDVEGHSFRTK